MQEQAGHLVQEIMQPARTLIFLRIKISYKLAELLMSFTIADQGRLYETKAKSMNT